LPNEDHGKNESTSELFIRAERLSDRVCQAIKKRRNIIVVSHLAADGIAASSILATAIYRKGGRYVVRAVEDINPQLLQSLKDSEYDLNIFCDLGAGASYQMNNALGNTWIVVDHHKTSIDEMKSECVFNPWQFGLDGSKEISTSGMTYILATRMDSSNVDLSWLAVLGAIGDEQDRGNSPPLLGLNGKNLDDAIRCGRILVTTDLILPRRETKPIHMSIASSLAQFLPGLSGNEDASLSALTDSGILLKNNGRWRTISDLSDVEKRQVVDIVIPYLLPQSKPTGGEELIREDYTLIQEDEHLPLRTVREFVSLLDACGRLNNAGAGVAICLGDRDRALQSGEKTLVEYRKIMSETMVTIMSEEMRVVEKENWALVNGDYLVQEELIGAISSMLSSASRFYGKILVVKATTKEGDFKFSMRKTRYCDSSINFGLVLSEDLSKYGGTGVGHDLEFEVRISASHLKEFLKFLDKSFDRKK
jgi:RecJ-like exonuclease